MEGQVVWQLVWSCATTALGIVVGWAVNGVRNAGKRSREEVRSRDEERDRTRRVLRLLLRAQLVELHRHYVVEKNPCPEPVKQDVQELYELYHALGGNGSGTHMYQEILECHVA